MNLTKHWAAQLDDYVIDLAWSPDGTRVAAASAAGSIVLFAAVDGARTDLGAHEHGANGLAFAPTTAGAPLLLASGGQDGAVKFWDATAGQHIATTKLGPSWVEHLAWQPIPASAPPAGAPASPSLRLLAAAGRSLVLLAPDGVIGQRLPDAPKTLAALAWHPTGACFAAAYFGGVQLWDGTDALLQKTLPYTNGIHALTWSPDGRWLVSGNQDPSVHLWIPEEDQELHMSGYESKVKELSFDRSSRWLATGGGREACLWDCAGAGPEGREPLMLPHEAKVGAVAFQHTHSLLATASQDGVLQLWSPERKQPLRATVRLPAAAAKLAWSPDDRFLAVGSEKGIVYVLRCED